MIVSEPQTLSPLPASPHTETVDSLRLRVEAASARGDGYLCTRPALLLELFRRLDVAEKAKVSQ